ncbi:quercetin 2,3-dioxygenase [Boeremia exigua]|uniref:quercetin 2,3-dioxygenase n=1 Tax=Boeremia exigua TaxID=749465 RepID=UPI001E8D499D|nr:quercetin 2,3-dioxygenase [Boeremia exigua]KAH6625342.1 quercetin 2,3-dioxygenase [Boeremia exigua]
MFPFAFASLIGLAACLPSSSQAVQNKAVGDLIVTQVPDYVRPYIVRAYALDGYRIGTQVYRFPVTGPSSGYAFSMISTAAPASTELGVLAHTHKTHFENFYCLRGRYALWTDKDNVTSGRILTPGDYGAVPHDTTHTFQILDPFVEMVGVIQPGGFEDLFYFLANENYTSSSYSPFPQGNFSDPGGDSDTITKLQSYDVYAQLSFTPPTNFGSNSATEEDAIWHNGANELAQDSKTPFFIAKGYGPKYLAGDAKSSYAIVEPFVTSQQSDGNFTQGTITLSKPSAGSEPEKYSLPGHTALEVVDGLVSVDVGGFDGTTTLSIGDVVFVPANTTFSFWGAAAYSKVLYVGAGNDTIDGKIIKGAKEWDSATWPQ